MSDTMTQDLAQLRGQPVLDAEGREVGSVQEIYYDDETNRPEWIAVGGGNLVPVVGASMSGGGLMLPYSEEQIRSSSPVSSDEVTQSQEAELYRHYGLEYSERRSDSGLPEGSGGAQGAEGGITRSEEELSVGKQQVDAGTVRLRKWVETEPVSLEVDLLRETARVTREPIDQPVDGAEIGEQEVEVHLQAEEAVVSKQAVAKERVSLETDVEQEHQTITDELRKERVEVEGDDVAGR
jgi:uncharacterized protein (TIGR02271 family)